VGHDGDCNLDKADEVMGYESGQAGEDDVVTMALREAGADVLDDPDLTASPEELAEAVYTAMEQARVCGKNGRPQRDRGSRAIG
jgi:hypothetical protein